MVFDGSLAASASARFFARVPIRMVLDGGLAASVLSILRKRMV